MNEQPASELKFDVGHVLFIIIVGYSKLLIAEQSNQIQTLREIVRGTEQFKKAEAEGTLLRLPTGEIRALQRRLSMPAGDNASIQRLKIDPVWDPTRNNPGFQQLLTMKERVDR